MDLKKPIYQGVHFNYFKANLLWLLNMAVICLYILKYFASKEKSLKNTASKKKTCLPRLIPNS